MRNGRAHERVDKAAAKGSTFLSLARCEVSDADVACIDWSRLGKCIVLDVSGNPLLTAASLNRIAEQMPQLAELSAYKCGISEISSGVFVFLRALHTLDLSDNRLKTLPNDLAKASGLRTLSLTSNRFTVFPHQLAQLRGLERLDMSNNPLIESHRRHLSNPLPFVATFPCFGVLGFGALLQSPETADLRVQLHTRDQGVVERRLHRPLALREPWFAAMEGAVVGDGAFSAEAWDAVISFLYSGLLRAASVPSFREIAELVREHDLSSLTAAVARELEALPTAATEQALPVVVDESAALGAHLQTLLLRGEGDFEISTQDGATLSAHACLLACRMEHVRALLRHDCRERATRRVCVDLPAATVRSLLEWVYTDSFGMSFECDLTELLEAARFFALDELSVEVQSEIVDNLDSNNAAYVLALAEQEGFGMLHKLATSFCRANHIAIAVR